MGSKGINKHRLTKKNDTFVNLQSEKLNVNLRGK